MKIASERPRASAGALHGLTQPEVAERRAAGEVNIVRRHVSRSYGRIVSQNLFTFLNLLVFGVSAVLAVLGLCINALLAGERVGCHRAGRPRARACCSSPIARASCRSVRPTSQSFRRGLVPLGLVALRDELRAGARDSIARFAQAGIAVKLISGDHANTIAALARQAGIDIHADQEIVTGPDLEGLGAAGYERVASQATIFGRVTP